MRTCMAIIAAVLLAPTAVHVSALEERQWDEAGRQIRLVADALERYAGQIERAVSAVE